MYLKPWVFSLLHFQFFSPSHQAWEQEEWVSVYLHTQIQHHRENVYQFIKSFPSSKYQEQRNQEDDIQEGTVEQK